MAMVPIGRSGVKSFEWILLVFFCNIGLGFSLSQGRSPCQRNSLKMAVSDKRLPYCGRDRQQSSTSSTALFVATTPTDLASSEPLFDELEGMRQSVFQCLRGNKYKEALEEITKMVSFIKRRRPLGGGRQQHISMSAVVDQAIRAFTDRAFDNPFPNRSGRRRISQGMQAIHLQLSSSSNLAAPYDTIPRATLLKALKALTRTLSKDEGLSAADSPFRVLQRLVTGVGIRHIGQGVTQKQEPFYVLERDFNLVLNAFSNIGRMDMAHRTVALQERTPHAPPLSPVTYSILLKGYGRLSDLENVEMTVKLARKKEVEPDTIMLNSLMDAYINCDAVEMAQDLFRIMKEPQKSYEGNPAAKHTALLVETRPPPNIRTYNTLLKGFAKRGALGEALKVSRDMKQAKLWDHVTTNTLVNAAVNAKNFKVAQDLLADHTAQVQSNNKSPGKRHNTRQHPNVEAYTELMDGYAKAGKLDKSLDVLQLMRTRGVDPTVVTYTCMVGNLAKAEKITQAESMMEFMKSKGVKPQVVTYNAFISGLVADAPAVREADDTDQTAKDEDPLHEKVNKAFLVFGKMVKAGIRPNVVTVSVLIDALGRCNPPRTNEAKALVSQLEKDGVISSANVKVGTAMIQCCAAGGDLKGSLDAFRQLKHPDVLCLNAFMDACCRCGQMRLAFDSFQHFFCQQGRMAPDVISYSVLISALLERNNVAAADKAIQLYNEMRDKQGIKPDNALIDIILKAMVKGGRLGLRKREVKFVLEVLQDAELLAWQPRQFERRKRAVRRVLVGRMSEVWKQDEELYGMTSSTLKNKRGTVQDDLLKRKGWNQVDSGFRLWGGGPDDDESESMMNRKVSPDNKVVDEFLASKGWNDVDSGFRII